MSDLDQRLQRHFDEARQAALPPDSWRRLDEKLTAAPARRPLWARREVVALAAAVVLLVAAVAVGAALRDDDADRLRTGGDGAASTTASTTEPVVGSAPDTMVLLVDDNGDGVEDVVLEDEFGRDSGTRVLVAGTKGPETGDDAAVSADLGSDGRLYYEACCEPPVGEIHAMDVATGEDLGVVTHGSSPAPSSDGRSLAVYLHDVGIRVVDLASGRARTVVAMPTETDQGSTFVSDLAWSPDRSTLAAEVLRYNAGGAFLGPQVLLVDVATGDTRTLQVDGVGADGLAMPAFLADGRLVVALDAHASADGGPLLAGSFGAVDPATGRVDEQFGAFGGAEIGAIDATADGRWVAVTDTDGAIRLFSGADGFLFQRFRSFGSGARRAAW